MIRLSRRDLIKFMATMAAYPSAVALITTEAQSQELKISIQALGPYLDTLIPKDSTPSATELDVDRVVFSFMQSNEQFKNLIALGCQWLDREALAIGAQEFSLLGDKDRSAIVTKAEKASADSLENIFFKQTRGLAFNHYYAQPESWPGLNYNGPPQPSGFRDYASLPKVVK